MDPRHAKRLHKHTNLTDILIQIEDFFDGLDLYVFKNWIEGEIHRGPEIRRYWVDITLKYEYKQMPDPQGAVRLVKHGAKVLFRKGKQENAVEIEDRDDYRSDKPGKPKMEIDDIWLVDVSIPRKFIEELDDDDLELFDDDIDTDNVSDARDENIDQDDAYQDGSQEEESEEDAPADDTGDEEDEA